MKKRDFSKINWKSIEKEAGKILGEDFWQDLGGLVPNPGPRVDAFEINHYVYVIMELPGLPNVDGIRVALKNSILVIEGEVASSYPVSQEKMIRAERFVGSFKKEIHIPCSVAPGSVRARYINGLLEIMMIKTNEEEKAIYIEYQGDNPAPY